MQDTAQCILRRAKNCACKNTLDESSLRPAVFERRQHSLRMTRDTVSHEIKEAATALLKVLSAFSQTRPVANWSANDAEGAVVGFLIRSPLPAGSALRFPPSFLPSFLPLVLASSFSSLKFFLPLFLALPPACSIIKGNPQFVCRGWSWEAAFKVLAKATGS